MNNIKKIVLTGGPCGGKTTSIQKIVEEFEEKNYKVIVVPEAATTLINMGITPLTLPAFEFQKLVLELSQYYEKLAYNTAKLYDQDVIIICDRGALDGKAYIDKNGFNKLLNHLHLTEDYLMSSYDLIIHLKTAADGKEEFYTLDNNSARTETIEEARKKDKLTLNAWLGHSQLKIIGNDTNFEEKINKVIFEIYNILNKPYPIQSQYKYLIKKIDLKKMVSINNIVKINIEQFIETQNNQEKIYRKTVKDNIESYKLIIKTDTEINNERIKQEKNIYDLEYYNNLPVDKQPIIKSRYCFEYCNQYFKLDIFDYGLIILEIDKTNRNQPIIIPDFIDIYEDITNDISFRNGNIYKQKNSNKIKKKNNN